MPTHAADHGPSQQRRSGAALPLRTSDSLGPSRRKTRKQTWEVRSPADQVPAGAGDGALDRRSVWEQVSRWAQAMEQVTGAGDRAVVGAGDGADGRVCGVADDGGPSACVGRTKPTADQAGDGGPSESR